MVATHTKTAPTKGVGEANHVQERQHKAQSCLSVIGDFCKFFLAVALAGITLAGEAGAQVPPLSPLQVSGPPNLGDFVRDDEAAKVLGEALFWDSSDGVQACATCHLRAGADPRRKNQISPGLLRVVNQIGPVVSAPDFDFDGLGPNYRLRSNAFRFRQLADPLDRESSITAHTNNVVSSQGVHHAIFGQEGRPGPDFDGFSVGQDRQKANVRRVEPRNTPQ
jgi:hypothetical protein